MIFPSQARKPRLVVDVDGTLTIPNDNLDYDSKEPRRDVIERICRLHAQGVRVVLYSARNMRTYRGNLALIKEHTTPVLVSWLLRHGVCYDELHMGKPWCGGGGLYVSGRSLRPDAFVKSPWADLTALLELTEQ